MTSIVIGEAGRIFFVQAPALPARITAIVQELYARNRDLARGDDDARRELTKKIAEQIVFEFPSQGYGWKSAGPGRPPSKDCFARRVGSDMWCWDWQNGGTREPMIPFHENHITGQVFIEVEGVNHLGSPSPSPTPAPAPSPSIDLAAVIAKLEALERAIANLAARLDVAATESLSAATRALNIIDLIKNLPAASGPQGALKGSVFGSKVILRHCPEPCR